MRPLLHFVLLVVSATEPALALASEQKASHQGKPVSYWFELALKRTNVDAAFRAMGSNAAPFLARELGRKSSKLDEKLSEFPKKSYIPEGIYERSLHKVVRVIDGRQEAARLLSELGPDAEPALPVLLRIFREGDEYEMVQTYVNNTLARMGDKIAFLVPELLDGLTNGEPHFRVLCARILGGIGPAAKPAVPALVAATESSDWGGWLAYKAGMALMTIDGNTNAAIRVLTNVLNGTKSEISQFALLDLGKLGPAAKSATPAIANAMLGRDMQVRELAAKTLRELEPALLEEHISKLNQQSATNITRLITMLQIGRFSDRFRAVGVLALYGPEAKSAVPALLESLDMPADGVPSGLAITVNQNFRRAVAETLGEIGPDAHAAVPTLTAMVKEHRSYFTFAYCKALGQIGVAAQEAIPTLEAALADESPGVRLAAARALVRVSPQASSNTVAVLKAFQGNPEPMFALDASVGLWQLGLEKQPPVGQLIERAKKGDAWAIELLGNIGPDAKAAVPILAKMAVSDSYRGPRAAIAIRKIDRAEAMRLGLPGLLAVP